MAESLDSNEVTNRYIREMGPALGPVYSALWNQCVLIHVKWADFVELYGTSPERVQILNNTASTFFGQLQSTLHEDVLAHLGRLTDRPSVAGKQTLTLLLLGDLVAPEIEAETKALLDEVLSKCEFARDWRNRRLSHADRGLALKAPEVKPLEPSSRKRVSEALSAIVALMNRISTHYCRSTIVFEDPLRIGTAGDMVELLRDGFEARAVRAAQAACRGPH